MHEFSVNNETKNEIDYFLYQTKQIYVVCSWNCTNYGLNGLKSKY